MESVDFHIILGEIAFNQSSGLPRCDVLREREDCKIMTLILPFQVLVVYNKSVSCFHNHVKYTNV